MYISCYHLCKLLVSSVKRGGNLRFSGMDNRAKLSVKSATNNGGNMNKQRSKLTKNVDDEKCRQLSTFTNELKKKKEAERSSYAAAAAAGNSSDNSSASSNLNQQRTRAAQLRKAKSESFSGGKNNNEKNTELRKTKSELKQTLSSSSSSDDDDDDNSLQLVVFTEPVKTEEEKKKEEDKCVVVKEIGIAEEKPKKVIIKEEEDLLHTNERPVHVLPSSIKKQSTEETHVRNHSPVSQELLTTPTRPSNNLQSLVDLVMWRDVSRSALIFGMGTFVIVSSSYTQDLNISIVSVLSSICLLYLAAVFLFRSFTNSRGDAEMDKYSRHEEHDVVLVGEEEAAWLVKLILPYVNEFLVNVKSLFSGDNPATTMKMAVLLFILARSGSSITIWKITKLGFLGVFMIPKIWSWYSTKISSLSTCWMRSFGEAWRNCSHKKAIAFGVFTFVFNFSSIFLRIWAVFMLFVVFKYYQQPMMRKGWTRVEDSWREDS